LDKIVIQGGERLVGEVVVSGSKNATLPIFVSSLLAEGENRLHGVPDLRDGKTICDVLKNLGVKIERGQRGDYLLDGTELVGHEAPYKLVNGGCAIGARPVNLHLKGLEKLGAEIHLRHGYIEAKTKGLRGADIYLDVPTVTGTENLMMAAALAKGETVIENAAAEPEIVELAKVLNKMGAKISGAGSNIIRIKGVKRLTATEHTVIPDRIEAGTFMIAAGVTRGNIHIRNCNLDHMEAVVNKLRETGMEILREDDGARAIGNKRIKSVDVKTLPYPGFPTDMQAQIMVLMTLAKGLSVISETIFENRFIHVGELRRMGADIKVERNSAIINGVRGLSGAPVMATDLRASASLVLAGLAAEGKTEVSRVYHLDRGYEKLEEKLASLGAHIRRVKA